MKIQSIAFTPVLNTQKYNNGQHFNNTQISNKNLPTDTVSFGGGAKNPTEAVEKAFLKLAKNRMNGKLGACFGVLDNVNIYLEEVSFAKKANLYLTNGKFGNKNFINLQISKAANEPVKIVDESRELSDKEAGKLAEKYLDALKG